MQTVFTTEMRGRTQTFDVAIKQVANTPARTARAVELAAMPTLRVSRVNIGYGIELLPSYTELNFLDPDNLVRDEFASNFAETDYQVEISGEGFLWKGRIQKTGRKRSIAPRVFPLGTTTLRAYDRLGGLKDSPASTTINATLADLIAGNLFAANSDMPIHWRIDAWPDNISSEDVRLLRFVNEVAGDEGEPGTRLEQLQAAGVYFGLRIFQSTADASWHVVHRASVGEAITSAQKTVFGAPYTWSTEAVTADEKVLALDEVEASDMHGLDSESAAGSVLMSTETHVEWIVDGCFEVTDTSGLDEFFKYWTQSDLNFPTASNPPSGCLGSADLSSAANNEVSQDIVEVTADENIFADFQFSFRPKAVAIMTIYYQVRLDAQSGGGTVHYLKSDGTWTTTATWLSETHNTTSYKVASIRQTESFPDDGELQVSVRNTDGDNLQVGAASFRFYDENGDAVTNFRTANDAVSEGRIIELERAPVMEYDETGAGGWITAQSSIWNSTRYGTTHDNLGQWQAADRINQQSTDLDIIDSVIWDLHGPQRRIRFDSDLDGADEYFIPAGLELHFDEETTRGVWVQVPDDVATIGSN